MMRFQKNILGLSVVLLLCTPSVVLGQGGSSVPTNPDTDDADLFSLPCADFIAEGICRDGGRIPTMGLPPLPPAPSVDTVIATIPVGDELVVGDDDPQSIAITPDGTRAYVALSGRNVTDNSCGIAVIDLSTNTKIETLPSHCARKIAITPDGTHAYTLLGEGRTLRGETLGSIDLSTNTVLPHIAMKKNEFGEEFSLFEIVISPDSTRAYFVTGESVIVVLDLTSLTISATIPIEGGFRKIAITPDGKRAYAVSTDINRVTAVDLTTNTVITTIPVGHRPGDIAITPDGNHAYLTHQSGVDPTLPIDIRFDISGTVIDLRTHTVVSTIRLGRGATFIVFTPDGTRAYSKMDFDNIAVYTVPKTTTALDPLIPTVVPRIPVGPGFTDLAISPDGTHVYVTNSVDETVSVIVRGVVPAITPSVAPTITPSVAPAITPSVTPAITPSVAPEVETPAAPTPTSVGSDDPDLTMSLTKVVHKPSSVGEKLSMKLTLQNLGGTIPLGQDEFWVSAWLSSDQVLDNADQFFTRIAIQSTDVEVGETFKLKLKLETLQSMAGKFVLVTIDSEDNVVERNEGNNLVVHRVAIEPGCPKTLWRLEREPTSAEDPQKIGVMREGTCITVRGNVDKADDIDGYRIVVRKDLTLKLTLIPDNPTADFDLAILDLETGSTVGTCESTTSPEICLVTLTAGTLVVGVVLPTEGTGLYTLMLVPQ